MTDYASQGKSREVNVVDLTNCRDHRAYYVALSRGKSAKGTVILQNFDEKKITSGMSGYLRQELRELEILDEITRLRHEGRLPNTVTGMYRRRLIRSYLLWKGRRENQDRVHPAMQSKDPMGDPVPEDLKYNGSVTVARKKRKGVSDGVKSVRKKRKPAVEIENSIASGMPVQCPTAIIPIGLVWDSLNYSCGYDAIITILRNIWIENRLLWTERF
ncbi:hypothetical protein B0H16DRAFT_1260366, partial [Mycena metata]